MFALATKLGLGPEQIAEIVDMVLGDDGMFTAEVANPEVGDGRHLSRLEALGTGGMAEVWLVSDARLGREVAMKVLRAELADVDGLRERFLREARATARLAHPGIVPVHEVGQLPDGRPFFTMDVVRGRTLDVVAGVMGRDGTGLRRVVDIFRRAVEAVAHAHAQGVLHRDLKPANIMVGGFGSVFVLDWGLIGWSPGAVTARPGLTLDGAVQGTPGYLAPEQARGEPADPRTDVFSLGLVLWELLAGRPAFDVHDPVVAIGAVASDRIPPCLDGPEELRAIVARAAAAEPGSRHPSGAELAEDLGAWLDGQARRERADGRVAEAAALALREQELRRAAAEEAERGAAALDGVEAWAGVDRKRVGWSHQDRRDSLVAEAEVVALRRLQALHGALTHDADHAGALDALCDHWQRLHVEAEARRDQDAAREALTQLSHHDRGSRAAYLRGHGRLTVRTLPEGVPAVLYRLEEIERRLVPVEPRPLGPTPAVVDDLPIGSWLVRFDGHDVVLPVRIRRLEDVAPPPVALVRPGALGPDDVLVPAGAFQSGSPGDAFQALPWAERSLEAYVIRRHPVTNAEYIAFLDDLVAHGREEEALRYAPHERGAPDRPGAQVYGRDDDGRFVLVPDADGDVWSPRWPVMLVDHTSACAFAAWTAERTGLPWRLPTELEWEKAARGVDGRVFPWGDRVDPSFCCLRTSHPGRPLPETVDAFPTDVSIYGVRGMAGNMRDWCADPFQAVGELGSAGEQRVLRGGSWYFPESSARVAARYGLDAHNRGDTISFRLARALLPRDRLGAGG
ncbi:MAG: SUMF1/EgtB/PvdO family nonheme iron enzyme [Alphaproteobacteria bacterium]|nr:SUMF1/EgtB/PvdO family nonheme iron enzyme [Alphaproteobacteria bacterium]MCB9696008.1 SUMF1/EgtB/PvdO family nonheme iron enzyme [Alphaproteobacteria bacterium]